MRLIRRFVNTRLPSTVQVSKIATSAGKQLWSNYFRYAFGAGAIAFLFPILILIGTWNEFLFAVVLGNQNAVTISRRIIGLNSFDFHGALNENPPPNLLASSGMIAVLPCLLLVLLFHRRIIAG